MSGSDRYSHQSTPSSYGSYFKGLLTSGNPFCFNALEHAKSIMAAREENFAFRAANQVTHLQVTHKDSTVSQYHDKDGNSFVHWAAILKSPETIDELVRRRKETKDAAARAPYEKINWEMKNQHGDTALHIAVELGDATLCRALLAAGASVHTRDAHQRSALDLAARRDNAEVRALLKAAADKAEKKASAFEHKVVVGEITPVEFLKLIYNNENEQMQRHLQKNPDLAKSADEGGRSALFFAMQNNNLIAVERLLAAGANPHSPDVEKLLEERDKKINIEITRMIDLHVDLKQKNFEGVVFTLSSMRFDDPKAVNTLLNVKELRANLVEIVATAKSVFTEKGKLDQDRFDRFEEWLVKNADPKREVLKVAAVELDEKQTAGVVRKPKS